jgi:uncharacterized damage-inducible protein DinB
MSQRKETLRQYLLEAHQRTWHVLSSLQPEDLTAAVYGDGDTRWTVREILGHLADAEPGLLGQVSRLVAGEVTVREDFDLTRWNRTAVRKRAGLAVADLLSQIEAAFQQALQFLDGLDESLLDLTGRHSSGTILSAEGFLRRMADHRSEHVADIQAALGR